MTDDLGLFRIAAQRTQHPVFTRVEESLLRTGRYTVRSSETIPDDATHARAGGRMYPSSETAFPKQMLTWKTDPNGATKIGICVRWKQHRVAGLSSRQRRSPFDSRSEVVKSASAVVDFCISAVESPIGFPTPWFLAQPRFDRQVSERIGVVRMESGLQCSGAVFRL
ncbi:hypothetical protein ACLOJK_024937 [Asimina triloba]